MTMQTETTSAVARHRFVRPDAGNRSTGTTAETYRGNLRFNVLGPLEVLRGGTRLELSGAKQRAVLGYLLLRPNQATATSELMAALWQGPAPTSARKMVQNAVWRLRNLLDAHAEGAPADTVSLRSRPPGYLLEVNPKALDLHRFHELAAQGRARMREGEVATASLYWREALALWRGSMLADLAEEGVTWPQLEATETARLDVLEEYFDAELALGRHDGVLPELQTITRAEPRRERFIGQLMLTLHRSGRHSEALDVYTAIRTELAEELGLEPGRRLQELRQAILDNDPALDITPLPGTVHLSAGPPARPPAGPDDTPPPVPGGPGALVRERREVSVALINAFVPTGPDFGDPERIDLVMAALHEVVRDEADRFGGTVTARIGSVWLVVFGARGSRGNEPMRAVLMALAVRHRIRWRWHREQRLRIRAMVDTGDALVQYVPDDRGTPSVTSAALDHTQSLLPLVPLDEIWVGKDTRERTDNRIDYERARVSATWTVRGLRCVGVRDDTPPLLDRADGVRALATLLDADRTGPRVALVVGDAGMGKSSMLVEFERLAARRDTASRPLLAHIFPCTVDDSPLGIVAAELCASCGIGTDDSPETARAKLWTTVERVTTDTDEAYRVFEPLLVAVGHVPDHERAVMAEEVVAAWLTLLERLAAERPVTVVIDDLHAADEAVLRIVDLLVDPACRSRLKVVAATRPELFRSRPAWGVASGRMVTVTLPRLSDGAVAQQTRTIIAASASPDRPRPAVVAPGLIVELIGTVTALADGNPLFAAEFVRLALRRTPSAAPPAGGGAALIPQVVQQVLQAGLDELPADLRAVVQDAAVIGEGIRPDTLAALRRQRDGEVAGALAELTRRGVLASVATDDGTTVFGFRQPLLREVAYAQIPQDLRAAKHAALAERSGGCPSPGVPRPPAAPELLRLRSVVERLGR
ncbi:MULTISPECIES: BTAD domain-containing putative transcriptional regulator [unclassified Streptomyces]|uniref:BTAD domain-containing putative transcriptional regulator n=1 Tax=unclassified Streptomyces TaxID=2593676 RepID=UPI00382ECDDD